MPSKVCPKSSQLTEKMGDVNMEVTHVKSKHNGEMVRREVVQRLNGLPEEEIRVIVKSMMAWKLWGVDRGCAIICAYNFNQSIYAISYQIDWSGDYPKRSDAY